MPAIGFSDERNKYGQFVRQEVIDSMTKSFIEDYQQGMSLNMIRRKNHVSMASVRKRLVECGIVIDSLNSNCKKCSLRNDVDEKFIIWLTGFFEGEGHLRMNMVKAKGKTYPEYQLGITQIDCAVLEYIKEKLGVGKVSLSHREGKYGNNKNCYVYLLSSAQNIFCLLKMIKPYLLMEKRRISVDLAIKRLGEKFAKPLI